MMEFTDTTTLTLLLVANAALLAAAAIAVLRFQKQLRRFEQFWNSPTGTSLANREPEEAPRPQVNPHLERRVTELQSVVRTLAKQQKPVSVPAPDTNTNLPIENAVRMARHGASIDDLVRSCGLNIGEARLMQKLHGKAQAEARIN